MYQSCDMCLFDLGWWTQVRVAIVGGTAVPMAMFLLWDAVILARLPPGAPLGDPLALLRQGDPLVGPVIEVRAPLRAPNVPPPEVHPLTIHPTPHPPWSE
eukprot:1189517-Prorocentrum_minimum.AAC.2